MSWVTARNSLFGIIWMVLIGTPNSLAGVSEITGRTNEPYYRREFKQEQVLYEETSNFENNRAENGCFSQPVSPYQPNHFLIFTLVSLLFLGSLCLISLDLLYVRRSFDEEPATRQRNNAPSSRPARVLTPPLRQTQHPRVIINDAVADDLPDFHASGRRHNNTPMSSEDRRI